MPESGSDRAFGGMGLVFRAVGVGLVEVLGVFLPGAVWTGLLLASALLFPTQSIQDSTTSWLAGLLNGETPIGRPTLAFFVAAITLGYVQRAFSVQAANGLWKAVNGVLRLVRWMFRKSDGKRCSGFPYTETHKGKPYYLHLDEIIKEHTGIASESLPRHRLFSPCKLLLRLHVPGLWLKVVQAEGLVRLLAGLAVAAFFSSVLALFFIVAGAGLEGAVWFIISILIALVSVLSYEYRRRLEVDSMYLYIIVARRQLHRAAAGELGPCPAEGRPKDS